MALPTVGQLADASVTQGGMKTRLEALLAGVKTMPGAGGKSTVTIASGVIAPTRAAVICDTEAAAASDNLDNITVSNYEDGGLLFLQSANASRSVVCRNAQGGSGELLLDGSTNFTLDSTSKVLVLRRDGTAWREVMRYGGPSSGSSGGVEVFTANGTFTVPSGVTTVWVSAIGGGGGGAGGGGGFGSGGGANASGSGGGAGGTTSFGAHVSVNGGGGGSGGGTGLVVYENAGTVNGYPNAQGGRGGAVSGANGQPAVGLTQGIGGLRTTSPFGSYGAGGAGGDGGAGTTTASDRYEGGGGGGAGGMSATPAIRTEVTGLTPGGTVAVTIGSGGTAGTGGSSTWNAGSNGGAGNAGVLIVEW